ncbi:NAD(P)-dependent oxidoreductase [Halobellus captivus]|uniref:NAD(P)-dependent oxidoreductase n=1 Tax=Halobellus captivus TaxID=2592614 RepID=UPI0011A38694|nr:NAD(P)-dependent oxidoreductase [Halobellus captivus]
MASVTVGQIGLGRMGGGIAYHLVDEGFDVIGFDIQDDALAEFEAHGGRIAESNAELASEVDILLSALSYPEIVEAAYLGDDGVVHGAHEDLICIEQSTVPPESTRELAADLRTHGIDLLDAPFFGGPDNARNGTVLLPVGGPKSAFDDDNVQAVFSSIARHTQYMGESGAGKTTKLVNNCISLGNTVLALEALSLGAAQGLDVRDLFDTLKFGAGSSVAFRVLMPSALNRDFEPGFPVEYTQKDLRYALRAAEDVDFPMHVMTSILQLYTAAAASGYAKENAPAVIKVFEQYLDEALEVEEKIEVNAAEDPILSSGP